MFAAHNHIRAVVVKRGIISQGLAQAVPSSKPERGMPRLLTTFLGA